MKQGFFIKCSIILILLVQSPHLLAQELTKEGRRHEGQRNRICKDYR